MTEWVVSPSNKNWLLWEEQLAPKAWLVCFKPNAPWHNMYWVNVLERKWSSMEGLNIGTELFVHHGDDPIMQLCLMEEMRKKYGEPPWVQSLQS
jgi:hypothetical protein